jgi:3-oxoacyl-[acyl-carrier protein] reductase
MKLKEKIAVVTGGGRGIGRAIATSYAQEGARVIVTAAREKAEIEEVASHIAGKAILADVTRRDDIRKLVDSVIAEFGRIDILVNNAGRGMKYVNQEFMNVPRSFWEADPDAWQMVIGTNVGGVFEMTRAVVPYMLKRGYGRVINISMNYETMKRKGFSPYGPSKAAVESMSIIWAQELEGSGVTLNVLLPGGATLTGMIPESFPQEQRNKLLDPAVMGPPAVFLASDEAKDFNGQRVVAIEWNKEHRL